MGGLGVVVTESKGGKTSDYQLTLAVKSGKFSATRFYNQQLTENRVDFAGWVWDRLVIPKHRFVYWQLLNSLLLTRDKLVRIMPIHDIRCPVCELKEESHDHVLFDCLFAKHVINHIWSWLGQVTWPTSISDLCDRCFLARHDIQNRMINAVDAATFYLIWQNRNNCLFNLFCSSPRRISQDV
ncbi:uncharacterized protein LOC133038454 [Cannabis sativa]|uniref:uncharacterized protein LOC133038454 n=1 Tax=Cannabis sativa TaxID=3483 RepID=UPI0029CAA2D1|nr:uncharacterized protein LOC133038454 [Cannabis sativa]